MLKPNFAVYLGKEKIGGFSGFIAEHNFFIVFEMKEGINVEQGLEMLQKIKVEASTLVIDNLASFDQFISQIITKYNFPSSFSLAAGYHKDKIMYLKTAGQGKIFLQRGSDFAEIIENDNSASGYIKTEDFFVFTTKTLIDLLGSDIELKTIFDHKSPQQIIEDLAPQIKGRDDEGAIALLLQFKETEAEQAEAVNLQVPEKINAFDQIKKKVSTYFETLQAYSQKSGKRKTLTLAVVIIILLILIWSVGLGMKRRNETEANEKVEKLKKQLGKQKEKKVEELEQLIKEKEGKIVKKEEKNYEEFYDLTLDSKGAKGDKLYLEKENVSIVDKGKGTIYVLSLEIGR